MGKLYVHKAVTLEDATALVETVEENMKGLTQREIKGMRAAEELYVKLGRPSLKDFSWMLTSGGILNCPVTIHDYHRWLRVHGPDLGSLKGKTVRRNPVPVIIEPPIGQLSGDIVL